MRQYFLFPVVFGFGLLFAGLIDALMPSWVGWWDGKGSEDMQHSRPTRPSNDSLTPSPLGSETSGDGEVTQLRVDGDFLKRECRKPFVKLPKEADCDPRSHVLVVTDDSHVNSEGRGQQGRDHVNREFAKAGLAGRFSFWPSEESPSERDRSKEGNHLLLQAKRHRKIYETLLRMKWACATIFEDNVRLVDDFFARLTSITVTESIPPFDVIFWGCNSVDKAIDSIDGQKQELAFGQPGPCLFAYTVSLQGAFLLLQAMAMEGEAMNWTDENVRLIRPHIRSGGSMAGSFWHVVPMMAFQG